MQDVLAFFERIALELKLAGLSRPAAAAGLFLGVWLAGRLAARFAGRRLAARGGHDPVRLRRLFGAAAFLAAAWAGLRLGADGELGLALQGIALFALVLLAVKLADFFFVEHYLERVRGLRIPRLPRDMVKGLLFLAFALLVLNSSFGVSITGIGITAAVLTGVLGFALQDTLANVFAGISLSAERPFAVGDWVRAGGHEGVVEHLSWRSTRLRTLAGDAVTIPNANLAKGELVNLSSPAPERARFLVVGVDAVHDPRRVREVLVAAAAAAPGVLAEPPPAARVQRFAESSIEYRLTFWCAPFPEFGNVEGAVHEAVWAALARRKLALACPVVEVRGPAAKNTARRRTQS